jgi:hypothetical protein
VVEERLAFIGSGIIEDHYVEVRNGVLSLRVGHIFGATLNTECTTRNVEHDSWLGGLANPNISSYVVVTRYGEHCKK